MEVPRAFYEKYRDGLVRLICAEVYNKLVYLTLVSRGEKQITIQFKEGEFETLSVIAMLKEIQNHYRAIDWSRKAPNWCYMNRSRRGVLRFKQQNRQMLQVKELCWAQKVKESDIFIDEFGPLEYRFGKWRGREVDIYRISLDQDVGFLDRAMKAYRRLEGMNMSYEFLGHVVDDDENVVGIMTEPMKGRCIELHDRKLVLDSMHKLNDIGWILDAPHGGAMLITDSGELRITSMHNVIELPKDPEEGKERIRDREQFLHEYVFGSMKDPCPSHRVAPSTRGKFSFSVNVMVPLSDPERILRGTSGGWVVKTFRDPIHVGDVEFLKLESAGIKRLWEVDSSDEEGEGSGGRGGRKDRPTKKLRSPVAYRQIRRPEPERYETPLPRLPVSEEDLPLALLPNSGVWADAASSVPLASVKALEVPSWMSDGPWLALASSRLEVIKP